MKEKLLWFCLCLSAVVNCFAQSVVLDINYEPNTTYLWTETKSSQSTVQYLGAEDMEDMLKAMGYEIYTESEDYASIAVEMQTMSPENGKIPYRSLITDYSTDFSTSAARNYRLEQIPLEFNDLEIIGVINQFQKMEIDIINGVDSLPEKNRVFTLVDNIHRSLQYPKEVLSIDQPVAKSTTYKQGNSLSVDAVLETHWRLIDMRNDTARIHIDFYISGTDNGELDGLSDSNATEGSGSGTLTYDMRNKIVSSYEYTIAVKSFREIMGISVETSTNSQYHWTMQCKK